MVQYTVGILGRIGNLKSLDSQLVFEETVGGSLTYSRMIIEYFVKKYNKDILLKIGTFGEYNTDIKYHNCNIHVIKTRKYSSKTLKRLQSCIYYPIKYTVLAKKISKDVDIFHLNNFSDGGLIKNFLPNVKVIYTIHGCLLRKNSLYHMDFKRKILDNIVRAEMKNGIKHSDAIIVVGKGMDPELYSFATKYHKKVFLIPNGVDTMRFSPSVDGSEIRERYNIPKNSIVIVSTSRFSKERRIEMLIKAFSKLNKNNRDIYLLIVGSGPRESELKALVNIHKLNKNVIFSGPVIADMPKYYAAADIAFNSFSNTPVADALIYNSSLIYNIKHASPISISFSTIEALATGLPLICIVNKVEDYKHISPKILRNDCGIVLPKDDLDTFTKVMELFITDEELRKEMGKNARAIALKKRNLDIMINQIVEVYKHVMDENKNIY